MIFHDYAYVKNITTDVIQLTFSSKTTVSFALTNFFNAAATSSRCFLSSGCAVVTDAGTSPFSALIKRAKIEEISPTRLNRWFSDKTSKKQKLVNTFLISVHKRKKRSLHTFVCFYVFFYYEYCMQQEKN